MEKTYIMIKPDGVRRGLTAEIIGRIERKGFVIAELKKMTIAKATAESHYGEHAGKPFFAGLVSFITSGPVVAMVVEGPGAILEMRRLMGATKPWEATTGSIRADFATTIDENIIHGSDSAESAEREIAIFFGK
jgi:nucleoside-diphosphate kinase